MTNDINAARNLAQTTGPGSPIQTFAVQICYIRGIDPYGQCLSTSMSNWQSIVFERIMFDWMDEVAAK